MIFDVTTTREPLLKIRREIVGSKPGDEAHGALVGVDHVIFELYLGGRLVGHLEASSEEVGLPEGDGTPTDESLRNAELPQHVAGLISRTFRARSDDDLLWLWLSEPYGYLPTLPLESMLADIIPNPVVRLSCDNVTPVMYKRSCESVLCFSCPVGDPASAVSRYLQIVPSDEKLQGHVIHVFADPESRALLAEQREAFELHEPPDSLAKLLDNERSSIATPYDARHPWLAWMLEALKSTPIDFVHFVCHGQLSSHQGAVVFANPVIADDSRSTRPLYAGEVDRFLDRLGAWSISISSPPGNPSISGLRYFEEQLAQMRCGPVVLHDLELDSDGSGLINTLRYYVDVEPLAPSRSVTRYWNPTRNVAGANSNDEISDIALTLQSSIERALNTSPETAATLRRALETVLARYRRRPETREQSAIKEGLGEALKFAIGAITKSTEPTTQPQPRKKVR